MNLLAQLPDPNSFGSIGWLVVCAAAAIAAINQIDDFVARRKDKPSPAEVATKAADTFVTKTACDRASHDIAQRFAAIEAQVAADRAAANDGRRALYRKIEEHGEAMHQMELRITAALNKAVSDTDAKSESRISDVHDRVNQVLEAVSELRGKSTLI